jgi:chemotaxis methyl-accepting protein methylase
MSAPLDPEIAEALVQLASRHLGFTRDSIEPGALRAVASALLSGGTDRAGLLERARRGDPLLVERLVEQVTVGETYFFRGPDQLQVVADRFAGASGRAIRGLSAGCSTGEEAYSLAACLMEAAPGAEVSVLGVDVEPRRIATAREGLYGAWSLRHTDGRCFWEPAGQGRVRVREGVRAATGFAVQNLLEPLAAGPFDVILCRNVLIYLESGAARAVKHALAAALSPGGVLVMGTVEADQPPPGLERLGAPHLQAFVRPPPRAARPAVQPVATAAPPPPSPPGPAEPPEPVRLHLEAIRCKEQGELSRADRLLEELSGRHPTYLPALLERGLLHARRGQRRSASRLMRLLLERARLLRPEEPVPGPEPLPLRYYVCSAAAFLGSERE